MPYFPDVEIPRERVIGRTLSDLMRGAERIARPLTPYAGDQPGFVSLGDLVDIPKTKAEIGLTLASMLPLGKAAKPIGQAVQAAKRKLPELVENYLKPLSTYTPTLYRETNLPGLFDFIEQRVGNPPDVLHAANVQHLAKGQGANRGVLVELDTSGLQGQVATRKPAWEQLYGKGEAEFEIKYPTSEGLRDAVRSVTITPEALKTREGRTWGARLRSGGYFKDWEIRKNPDGSTTYLKPVD